MKRKEKLPELLAPAGDFECLVAAVAAGADAVYVGGKSFSARAYAGNFDAEGMSRAVAYCHLHGVKLYVTLNTLLYDSEIESAVDFARSLYRIGVDALIVADLGLIRALRVCLPDMELHASTQMSVHNTLGADQAYALGCSRVVLAREVSYADMRAVTEACSAEVEVFIHGALCVCHSGQCLFSSLVGGRSGNRGECAQPCRLPYNGGRYPLSLTDLSLAGHVPELIESGVASLKIEGRMKSPDYVYTVTSIYRRLLDEGRTATAEENRVLQRAFSRDGFTDAYFRAHPEEKMTGVRSEADKAESRSLDVGEILPTRVPTVARVTLKLGEPAEMTLTTKDGSRSVTVTGDEPAVAKSAPLSRDAVTARLAKMGNTFLSLDVGDIEVMLDDGINMSPASLNALRRSAASALELPLCDVEDIPLPDICENAARGGGKKHRTAIFYRIGAYNRLGREADFFNIVFLPLWLLDDGECRRVPNGIAMPPVIMESEIPTVRRLLESAKAQGVEYALVGNLGHIPLVREYGFEPVADFRFNVMNSYTRDAVTELGIGLPMLSVELTAREACAVGGREIVYGRLPLMITERCFMRDLYGCRSCSEVGLTDRRGFEFPMVREFEHRNLIFNSAVTYVADKREQLALFDSEHYIFTTESASEICDVIEAYKRGIPAASGASIRRIGKREFKK